jgi:ankyrin repeat protein
VQDSFVLGGQNGNEATVRQLLRQIDVNPNARSHSGWTALIFAACNGHAAVCAYCWSVVMSIETLGLKMKARRCYVQRWMGNRTSYDWCWSVAVSTQTQRTEQVKPRYGVRWGTAMICWNDLYSAFPLSVL